MRRWLELGLVATGLLSLAVWGTLRLDAAAYRRLAEREIAAEAAARREAAARGFLPAAAQEAGAPPRSLPMPIGRIEIPRVGVSAVIAEGTSRATLRRAVGHVSGTALPGALGNTALAGHRDGLFRPLQRIRVDDHIQLVTADGRFTYRVEWAAVVPPHRVDLIRPTPEPSLTLVTCYPFRWVGPAPDRFVVRASLVDGPRDAPGS